MENDQENSNEEENVETILSLCWDSGKLAAVVYNLTTLELNVSF
jgi:hypothetical protein